MSIRLRLTLWYSGILAVALLLFGIGLLFFLTFTLEGSLKADLRNEAQIVKNRIQPALSMTLSGDINLELQLDRSDIRSNNMYLLQVYNIKSEYKSKSYELQRAGAELPLDDRLIRTVLEKGEVFEHTAVGGIQLIMYSQLLVVNGQIRGILQVAQSREPFTTFMDTLQTIFALAVLVSIVIAATVGWFLARKALRPIEQVITAAGQIERGVDLSRRIEYGGPQDEIGRLTTTINNMLSRIQAAYTELEDAYAAQRRFVSDASHELRTPLTTIRGNVDLLEKIWNSQAVSLKESDEETLNISLEAMRDIADEAQRMSRLVNDLLSLARADAGVEMQLERVEMRPMVDEVIRRAQFLPKTAEWRTGDLSSLDEVTVHGNKDYLQQMLFIFIENAFKYTSEGYVQLDAVRSRDQIGLRIADTGIGMDREEVPHIFDRFFRADQSRGKTSGIGLGLSIAKWIVDMHKGSVEVTTRMGEGTTFLIWLPVITSLQLGNGISLSRSPLNFKKQRKIIKRLVLTADYVSLRLPVMLKPENT